MELYDEEVGSEPWKAGIRTLEPLEPTSRGPEEMAARVEAAVEGILREDAVPVMLGGEHSITLGAVRACLKKYPDLSVLQFDAHADMRDSFQDSPFSHACVARRVSELCPVVQAGIRSMSAGEARFLGGNPRVGTRMAADMKRAGLEEVAELLASETGDPLYITVDLDVFDPSVMPATGTPEPGGLDWYEVTAILKRVIEEKKVVGFDVVELSPVPGLRAPDFMAARLVYRIMAYINRAFGR